MPVVMLRLCRLCLKTQSYAEHEVVFSAGDDGKKMYFIKDGIFQYTTMDGVMLDPPPQAKEWVSEAVLWTAWRHMGALLCVSTCDLLFIEPNQFVEVMRVHPRPWFYAKRYAEKFIQLLNSTDKLELLDILRDDYFYAEAVSDSDWANSCVEAVSRGAGSTLKHDSDACAGNARARWDAPGNANSNSQEAPDHHGKRNTALAQSLSFPGNSEVMALAETDLSVSSARRCMLNLCPCVAVISCDPWCSINVNHPGSVS